MDMNIDNQEVSVCIFFASQRCHISLLSIKVPSKVRLLGGDMYTPSQDGHLVFSITHTLIILTMGPNLYSFKAGIANAIPSSE